MATTSIDQEMFINRSGNRMMNLVHFGDTSSNLQKQARAEKFLQQIYAMPLDAQPIIADQIAREYDDLSIYLHYSAARTGHFNLAKAVLDSGTMVLQGVAKWEDSIVASRERRNAELFDTPLEKKAVALEEWLREFSFPEDKEQLMFDAAVAGDVDVVRLLLRNGVVLQRDDSLATLHAACFNGRLECAQVLIESGADVNVRDEFGGTPLMRAAVGERVEVVQWLLNNGAIGSLRETREGNYNALEFTAGRSAELVRLLIGSCGLSTNALMAASSFGNDESFDLIFEAGNFPPAPSQGGNSLFWNNSVSNEQKEAIVGSIDQGGAGNSTRIMSRLLAYIPKGQLKDHEEVRHALVLSMQRAVCNSGLPIARMLLPILRDEIWRDRKSKAINDLLVDAAQFDGITIARFLLDEQNAETNTPDSLDQTTALYRAASRGHKNFVSFLITEYGPDIHLGAGKFANGPTALAVAIQNQHEEVVRTLLAHGGPVEFIDPNIQEGTTKRVFASVARSYRFPVRLTADMDPEWDVEGCTDHFICLEYPDGWSDSIVRRRLDSELKDDREMRKPEQDGFVLV